MRYNVVYKEWQAVVDDILPTRVESWGITESSKNELSTSTLKKMHDILQSHPQAVPSRVYSFGYGPNVEIDPYWRGPENEVLKNIKDRIAEFGMANVIPLVEPFSPENANDFHV